MKKELIFLSLSLIFFALFVNAGTARTESKQKKKPTQVKESEVTINKFGEPQDFENWTIRVIEVNKYELTPGKLEDIERAGCKVFMEKGTYDLETISKLWSYCELA